MSDERPWTYTDFGAYTGHKPTTLRVMLARGQLPESMGFGKSRRWEPEVVRTWFRERMKRFAARAATSKARIARRRAVLASLEARA
jgi:hypothetical protein